MIRAALITLALAGAAFATQPPPMPGPGGHDGHGHGGPGRMFQALGLSPDQDKSVRAILDKRRPAEMALRSAAEAKDEELHRALEDPAATEPQIRALHAAAAEARLQVLLDHRAMLQEISAVLTPEQRAKAATLRASGHREPPPPRD